MLVSRVVGDCPGCGAIKKFGNVLVRRDHVLRGCSRCNFSVHIPLPPLRKKILYLDQCFFSHAFRGKEHRFVEAAERLREVSALQLIVAPFSSVHEDETNQWRGHEADLMKFIKQISFGHEFEPDFDVEEAQLCRAFEAFLSSGPTEFKLHEDDAVEEAVHDWDEYVFIDIAGYRGDAERIRIAKQGSVEAMVDAFEHLRTVTRTFDQQVVLEMEEQARQYLRAFIEHSVRLGNGNFEALFDSPLISRYVQRLLEYLPQYRIEDGLTKLGHFFRSEYYNQIPYLWLGARIYACLHDEVRGGAYTNREKAIEKLRGFYGDMKHAATYAPYCDAIFMEKKMTAYLSSPRINLEARYGVELFSADTLEDFIIWLDRLIDGMTDKHREGLSVIFPEIKHKDARAFSHALLGKV